MSNMSEMEGLLRLLPDPVRKGVTIVPRETGGPMYHMSIDGSIKRFIPSVTRRTGEKENRSVPRVSVAPTLLGCFVGYVMAYDDFSWPVDPDKVYKGGWYVYDIPYEMCLKPNSRLLYDQRNSDEHWLVTYNEDSRVYPASKVARCFYSEIRLVGRNNKIPWRECTLLVEVLIPELPFSKRITLSKGYWELKGPEPSGNIRSWDDDRAFVVREISAAEFQTAKGLTAEMLSAPTAFRW